MNKGFRNDLPLYQSSDKELLDGLEVGGLGGREAKEGDWNGEQPGPFPEKRLKRQHHSKVHFQKPGCSEKTRFFSSLKRHLGHK